MLSTVENALSAIGKRFIKARKDIYDASCLINNISYWTFIGPLRGKGIRIGASISEMVRVGYNSIPIVCVISFFVGIILALQSAYQLKKFGALIYVADLVGVALTRELGPVITAIIVAGRSGSAFAAEIGSMKANEEIDALISMGIHPVKYLVVPKLIAMMIMQPALTIIGDFIGILGGFFLAVTLLQLNPLTYYLQTVNALYISDVITGLVKAWAFSVVITTVGSYHGFKVQGGAVEVGRRTTASVVSSILLVIACDFFFTVLFYFFI
ncbi:toluene ABC transporter permease [Candidatus Magnetoovum chiemensis]|nr:toluene ABC transporter permease [Candidatus Magnetoovum chiemensis]